MKQIENVIKITCETKDKLELNELTEFQGELKKRDDDDVRKMIDSIKTHGFSIPFFVWKSGQKNYILDGHGRIGALRKLDAYGYIIPPLPVVFVDCEDERSARDLLLRINSQYGKMTKESVMDFIGEFELDVSNYELPSGTIKFEDELPNFDFGEEPAEESKSKLGILVECDSEEEMENTFNKLRKAGLKCRMVEN